MEYEAALRLYRENNQKMHDNLVEEWEKADTAFRKAPTSEAVERLEAAEKAVQIFMRNLGLLHF